MDLLPTLAHLAGADLPSHLVLDGVRQLKQSKTTFNLQVNIAPLILLDGDAGTVENRPVFFYRGDLLYAIRMNLYKVPIFAVFGSYVDFSPKNPFPKSSQHVKRRFK